MTSIWMHVFDWRKKVGDIYLSWYKDFSDSKQASIKCLRQITEDIKAKLCLLYLEANWNIKDLWKSVQVFKQVFSKAWYEVLTSDEIPDKNMMVMDPELVEAESREKRIEEEAEKKT